MNSRLLASLITLMAAVFFLATGSVAVAAPTAAEITGEIERLTLTEPNNIYSGGVMIVGGTQVILPKNLLIDLPANRLTLQQLFAQAPAACITTGESGLAKADKCNSSGTGGFVTLSGVHSTAGNIIAGDVLLEKGKELVSGVVSYINYTDGYFRVNGLPNDAATGVMVRLNDPTSRHTIQQGAGCAGGPNCSPDPRFTLDPDNYVNTFSSGYPFCIPSTVARTFTDVLGLGTTSAQSSGTGTGDVLCPRTNRAVGAPAVVVEPDVNDSRLFAPIVVGDSIQCEGNYEAINGTRFLSAHTSRVNKALSTKNLPTQPDYMFLEEVFLEAPSFQNQRARMLIIGFTTLAPTDVDFWTIHRDPVSNAVHEFPLASIQGCDNAAGAGSCGTLGLGGGGGAGNNIFRIRYDVDFLLARSNPQGRYPGGARNDLNPCWQLLNSPRFSTRTNPPATNPGICPGATAGTTTGAGITLEQNFGIMSPIPHEIQARTGHSLDNPGSLITLDIRGNQATNGQYLFPFGMNLGGVETADFLEIDVNLLSTPRTFEGIPWNHDRRLSPGGCLNAGGCEAGPLGSFALDPFPYTGLDPRTQADLVVGGVQGGTPKGSYSDANFTHSLLSNASNRVFSYVSGTPFAPSNKYNFDGNNTLLPCATGACPPDPGLIPINPTPALNIFPPIADEDSATTSIGVGVTISVLTNDVAVLGNIDPASVKLATNPANGTAFVNLPAGTITYTPAANFSGTDTFTYTVANNFGSVSLPGTVTVEVRRKPVAVNDSATVPAKSSLTFSLVANDIPGTSAINLNSVSIVSPATCGSLINNLDGDVLFTAPQTVPSPNTCTFSYLVGDINVPPLLSNVATVTVTITPPPAPVAGNDTASTTTDAPVVISVIANDTSATSTINPATLAVFAPAGGTAFANLNGTVTYTPPATPGIYTFTYTVNDNAVPAFTSNIATVTVTVTQGHNPPVANNDAVTTTNTSAPTIINVIGNDTATAPAAIDPASLTVSAPTGGSAAANANGTVTYTPPVAVGTYSFTYTVKDNAVPSATSNVATVTLTVGQGTVPPVAASDAAVTTTGSTVTINVIANDTATAPDSINPASVVVTTPTGGTAVANPDGTVTYAAPVTPGVYTFTYTVKDNHAPPQTSNSATVLVTVPVPGTSVTLTELPPNPQLPGAQILFTASGSGSNGVYEYEFWLFNGTTWGIVRPYSTVPTWTWDTTNLPAGPYTIAANVRVVGSTSVADAVTYLQYQLTTPATTVILTPNIASPQLPGTTVTLVAAAAGGSGTYEYRFWIFDGTNWILAQNYSPKPTLVWHTDGFAAGNYLLAVDVRNVASPADREAVFYLGYTLTTPVTSLSVISDQPSPHPNGTPVIFAASGTGGSGTYEYEFNFFDGTTWSLVKTYSGTDTWTLPGTTAAGNYVIGVNVRNAGASNGSDVAIFVPYVVQ